MKKCVVKCGLKIENCCLKIFVKCGLKTENCCLKIFVKIRVGEKVR